MNNEPGHIQSQPLAHNDYVSLSINPLNGCCGSGKSQGKIICPRSGKIQGIFILIREYGKFEKKSWKNDHGQGKFMRVIFIKHQYSVISVQ